MPLITDRLDLLLDSDGDLVLDGEGLHWATGLTGVVQLCRIAIQQFKGEWFANLDLGVPWFDDILGAKPALAKVREFIRTALAGVPGVLSVTKLTLDYAGATRSLTIDWAVTTEFGDTPAQTDVIS